MDKKEEGILLGELKEFKNQSMLNFSNIHIEMNELKREIKILGKYKLKIIYTAAGFFGAMQAAIELLKHLNK